MELDDAIRSARALADAHDEHLRQEALRKQQERAEVQKLLVEAVEHLQPHGTESFVRVKRVVLLGEYAGPDGQRFRQVSRQRCWRLTNMAGHRGGKADGPWMESPVLLLA